MTSDSAFLPQGVSRQRWLSERGIIPCEIGEDVTATRILDIRAERLIRTTTGEQLLVSIPKGLRSSCFRVTLPQQQVLASTVINDIDALAARVGRGDPAKGIGIAANQSESFVECIRQMADEQPLLDASQREASVKNGAVPAFFRYQDPDGNIIRIFNPSDSTPRNPDRSYEPISSWL